MCRFARGGTLASSRGGVADFSEGRGRHGDVCAATIRASLTANATFDVDFVAETLNFASGVHHAAAAGAAVEAARRYGWAWTWR